MAGVTPVASALTYADYLALPDSGPRLELIDGTSVAMAGPGRLHQAAVTEVVRQIGAINDQYLLISGRNATGKIVHVLEPVAGQWQETSTFMPSGGGDFASHISMFRRTVVVGAAGGTNAGGVFSGAAYVFDRVGNAFAQSVKLTASDGAAGDSFGFAASIWGDRDSETEG